MVYLFYFLVGLILMQQLATIIHFFGYLGTSQYLFVEQCRFILDIFMLLSITIPSSFLLFNLKTNHADDFRKWGKFIFVFMVSESAFIIFDLLTDQNTGIDAVDAAYCIIITSGLRSVM
jgi:hypothetical protein